MSRCVFDTNVVVSALLFESGSLRPLRQAWISRRATPLVNAATLGELIAVVARPKFALTTDMRKTLVAFYAGHSELVTGQQARAPILCRDADDQKFLDLAFAAGADALISGDKHLLELADRAPFAILTPRAFLDRL